jgi:plastocyanin
MKAVSWNTVVGNAFPLNDESWKLPTGLAFGPDAESPPHAMAMVDASTKADMRQGYRVLARRRLIMVAPASSLIVTGMRRLVAIVTCFATACGSDLAVTPGGPTPSDVYTPGNVFSPFSTVIPVGGTVRFNISGDQHNVIFGAVSGAPANVNVVQNVIVARTFTTRGTFPYDCTVHPGMSGQVVVQ